MAKVYSTPGVYVEEQSAAPGSVVPAATAVPAFIGYTEKAERGKQDLTNVPTRISSFDELVRYFGGAPKTTYDITTRKLDYKLELNARCFLLFNSMRLFFANGGDACYIVSIGDYDSTIAAEDFYGEQTVGGKNVPIGIDALLQVPEPTMVVVPDAVLLPEADCYLVQQLLLEHCGGKMRSRIAILDVYDGFRQRSRDADDVIDKFRAGVGEEHLDFAAAYYPWLNTTIVTTGEVDFLNIAAGTRKDLVNLLKADNAQSVQAGHLDQERAKLIDAEIEDILRGKQAAKTVHQTLMTVSPLYQEIMTQLRTELNLLPPSGGIAGVYVMMDNNVGVWKAPANVSLGAVIAPAVPLTNGEQEDLNVPLSGKAVNAIRAFPGKGVLVWGARTMAGNSQDWRYISVRRLAIFIEQSVKDAMTAYVFEPNASSTWANVKATVANFLTTLWAQGALAGATAAQAFGVEVGLGTTMTAADVLEGVLRVSVRIAVARPAEFIVIDVEQEMAGG